MWASILCHRRVGFSLPEDLNLYQILKVLFRQQSWTGTTFGKLQCWRLISTPFCQLCFLPTEVATESFLEEKLILSEDERKLLWSPNFSIMHLMEFTKLETLKPADFLMVVPDQNELNNFELLHQGTYVVRLKCPMEFDTFPFDHHLCYFEVSRPSRCVRPVSRPRRRRTSLTLVRWYNYTHKVIQSSGRKNTFTLGEKTQPKCFCCPCHNNLHSYGSSSTYLSLKSGLCGGHPRSHVQAHVLRCGGHNYTRLLDRG